MELVIKPFRSLPCELEKFTINGKAANSRDFGSTFDHNEKRKSYGCGDHTELFWKGIHTEEEIINLIKNDSFLSKQFNLK